MAAFAFILPILPGKEETDIQMIERFKSEEKDAFEAWRASYVMPYARA